MPNSNASPISAVKPAAHSHRQQIRPLLNRLVNYVIPSGLSPEDRAKRVLICALIGIAIPVMFAFSIMHFHNRDYVIGLFLLSTALLMLASTLHARRSRSIINYYRINLAFVGLLFLYHIGTSAAYPNRLLWTYIFPLESFYLLGRKEGFIFNGVYVLGAIVLVNLQDFAPILAYYDTGLRLEYIISLFVVTMISYSFEAIRAGYERGMKAKQASLEQEIVNSQRLEKAARESLQEQLQAQAQLIQSSKLASIGELASGVAHELNQPLMVIRTTTQLLNRGDYLKSHSQEKLRARLTLLDKNTARMANIIDHLRTFSRHAEGDFEPIAVKPAIEGCFAMLGEQLQRRNITVELNLAEDLPPVMGNATQLEQVILNVIINARDAIEAASFKKGATKKSAGLIAVTTRLRTTAKPEIEILIYDNGSGIEVGVEKLFDPFFTTKEVGKGTGLGLSISYGIITAHKGRIEVAETGPAGTTFRIVLPVTAAGHR